jgi:hypothetical protein
VLIIITVPNEPVACLQSDREVDRQAVVLFGPDLEDATGRYAVASRPSCCILYTGV